MTVGASVVHCLVENGIDTVFGIPGTQSLPLNESIDGRDDVRFVMARHETAVSHQAWGYAESTGRPAASIVIPGPGDMNAMNGLKNALNDCTPMLHVAVETDPDVRGGDGIHETPPDTYDNVVKENVLVQTPESTVAELERAIAAATTPPKGPVRVGIPRSFLSAKCPLAVSGRYSRESVVDVPDAAVEEAAALLGSCDAPLVIAGGGVRAADASDELRAVAERLGAPVMPTYKGKGVFPEDHDLFAGIVSVGSSANMHACIDESDGVLAVGTDLDAVTMQGWEIDLPDPLVHVTLDPDDVGTAYSPRIGIVADAKDTLAGLADSLGHDEAALAAGADRAGRVRDRDRDLMADVLSVSDPPLTSASVARAVREVFPRDGIVSVDAGGFRIWSLYAFETYEESTFIDTGSWATMGTGLPAAMGAQVANPERAVLALTGGGGLLMCLQELHTAAVEEIPVVVVTFNNDDYATISAEAANSFDFPEAVYGWAETPVSFTGIAESLGVMGVTAETPSEIEAAVSDALERDAPTLVEVPTDPTEPQAKPID
jgi:acetolactate synthase-1/2/3 large subunit